MPRPLVAGILVFFMAFGLYAATTQQLTGYEPEVGAVTEGLVLEGHFWDVNEPAVPLAANRPGKGGHLYARAGLLQPLLEAPFWEVGHLVDGHLGWDSLPYRYIMLWFYNPFVAALAVVAMFALVYQTRRSLGWAAVIATLFAFASLAWPYAKIGMETTFMFTILATFALGVWARQRPSVLSWGLTGFAAGATIATKAYAGASLVAIAVLLWPTFMTLERRQRLRLTLAVCLPVLLWLAAVAWYNWSRFGSVTNFGEAESALTLSAPLNMLGLLFSPGKGLLLYSPLVVLGALGMPRLWRQDRSFAAALLCLLAVMTAVAGSTTYWGDETWGPRYIVPIAWTLLVPIAWWVDSLARRRILIWFTVVACSIQVISVGTQYAWYMPVVQRLGAPVYTDRSKGVPYERIPYGLDPTRWIPQLSPLLLETENMVSQGIHQLGGDGLTVTYDPFEGRSRSLNLSDPSLNAKLDFWWSATIDTLATHLIALFLFLVAFASGIGLWAVSTGKTARQRLRLPAIS